MSGALIQSDTQTGHLSLPNPCYQTYFITNNVVITVVSNTIMYIILIDIQGDNT